MIWILMNRFFFKLLLSSLFFSLLYKYLTVSMLTGSFVGSTLNQSTGCSELESVQLKVPVVFFFLQSTQSPCDSELSH